jgi:hypothetical protein
LVGDLLEPRSVGEVRVFVQDCGNVADCPGKPAKRRRPIPVQMKNVDALSIDYPQQITERQRVELRAFQIGDVDAQCVECFF